MRAGLHASPHYGGKEVTGTKVANYKGLGRVYAIAEKGKVVVILHLIRIMNEAILNRHGPLNYEWRPNC